MPEKVKKIVFGACTFLFTLFVFLNTYEVVFNKDIILAESIRKVGAQQTINSVIKEFSEKNLTDDINASGSLEDMNNLEIPALTIRLHMEEARRINGIWYERPGTLHYIGLNKNQHNRTIDYLLYTTESWRTITQPDHIEKGMKAELYYGAGSIATFTIVDKKILAIGQSLLVDKSNKRQLLLIVENAKKGVYYGYSLELKE